ncbi:unnamed protein product [Euphydryas editha]|uniref:PiggyBac transposable element-derived protein domain-containing protein n=1 Tax=Euphydryas editha TaxID=104508 RepID=A0AAU9U8U3_EUPED|nr:unnamed protein product [Euphydryas editha]
MSRGNKRCRKMLDLAFKSDVVEEDRSDLVEKDKSDIAEDTIPKYRRVYQRITAESLPSSRKVEILHNVRIRSPITLDVTASTSGCSMTPKRRKILNDNIEEGNPQIFLSPSTRSSFHVLQNAEIQKSPASDQFEVKKNWSPFCEVIRNKDLNISSTVSRCSSVSNLSCAQYLTCPLSDDQVTEILATNENFSLVRENTCDEPTSNPKCLDNINSSNNIQKCIDPSEEALFKSPNNHLSNNIKKGIKLSEEALIKSPNNDSSNNIQKGIEPSEDYYAYNYIDSSRSRMKPKSRLKAWVPTDSEEMKRFLGVLMAMGLVKVPHINDYWSKKSIYKNEYIMSVMKRDRFLLLLKCWHFSDPQSTGKLSKIHDVYLMLLNRFQTILKPGKFLIIDESMIPWRGRLRFRQYIAALHEYPHKP